MKPDICKRCPINHVTEGFVPPFDVNANELIVGEAPGEEEIDKGLPFVGGAGNWLNALLRVAKLDRKRFCIANVICCRPPNNVFPLSRDWFHTTADIAKKGVEYCKQNFLYPFVRSRNWQRIIAMGDHALSALTPRRGITVWRGSPLPLWWEKDTGPNRVIPTYHPAYLMRDAKYFSLVASVDLRKDPRSQPPENYNLYPTVDDIKAFTSKKFVFDFEWNDHGEITLCGLSDRYYHAVVVPWTSEFLPELKRIFEEADELIGHNVIGADSIYLEKLGWNIKAKLTDTMLMQHLVQPDYFHGLWFVASAFTNKTMWKGGGKGDDEDSDTAIEMPKAQWKTWSMPDYGIPRELGGYLGCKDADEAYRLYNARDCDANLQCYYPIVSLMRQYDMEYVYENVSVPIAYICRDMNEAGLKLDTTAVKRVRFGIMRNLLKLDRRLPAELRSRKVPVVKNIPAPPNTYREKTKVCRGTKSSGTSHEPLTITFDRPGVKTCPVCNRSVVSGPMQAVKVLKKTVYRRVFPWNSPQKIIEYAKSVGLAPQRNLKTNRPTADKTARKKWHKELRNRLGDSAVTTEFTLLDEIRKNSKILDAFAKAEYVLLDRVYFRLNPTGTSEGRLSCTGKRKGLDPNIQQQPKDIRKLYIPDHPDWGFITADIIQGENMLTAWLAKDYERLERLFTPGFDEHAFMAGHFFNLPWEECKPGGKYEHMRKPGKIINHGRNYGLGAIKTQEYLSVAGYNFTVADVREMMYVWKKINRRTAQWQDEVVELVKTQSYLRNPFGRKRWFGGRDYATKALAFLPASTLADIVFRMMIALRPDRWMEQIHKLGIREYGMLPEGWRQRIQVHDEITCQGPSDTWEEAVSVLVRVMTQPWPEIDNFGLGVEIGWSGRGGSWGNSKRVGTYGPAPDCAMLFKESSL